MSHNEYGVARWLGRLQPRSDLPWVVDRLEGDHWVESGRHASREEAEAMRSRLVASGQGDTRSFRVSERPTDADESGPVLRWILVGLVAIGLLVLLWAFAFRP
jgi:hypothetical protein